VDLQKNTALLKGDPVATFIQENMLAVQEIENHLYFSLLK
jgi:hypothetical protein